MFALNLVSLRRLLQRPLVVFLSILGITAGVALVVAVNGILSSLRYSIEALDTLDAESSLEISARSPLGFPEELAQRASTDPDVTAVSPQVRQAVMVNGEPAMLLGRSDVSLPLAGSAFLSEGVGSVSVQTRVGLTELTVASAPGGAAEINGGRILLLPLTVAQELTGRVGLIDSAPIVVQAGTGDEVVQRLEATLGPPIFVVPADAEQHYALSQMQQVQQPIVLMSFIALVAGGFLVFNTVQSSARQREREIATLRALGGSKRQVATGLFMEAVLLGVLGSGLGLIAGVWLGWTTVNALPQIVSTAAGTKVQYHFDASVIPLGLLAGIGVAIASAFVPIRQILRRPPNQVLQGRPSRSANAVWRSRRTVGIALLVLLVGAIMSTSSKQEISQNGVGVLLLGFLMLGFGLIKPIARLAGWVAAQFGSLGPLVQADVRHNSRRVWSVAAAVFTAIAMYITVAGSTRNNIKTTEQQLEITEATDVWVTTATSADIPLNYFYPSKAAEGFRKLPGVSEVISEVVSYSVKDGGRFGLIGTDGAGNYPVIQLAGPEAVEAMVRGDGAIVTTQFARLFDLEVGDTFDLAGATGPMELEVLGISRTVSVSNIGTVVINLERYVAAMGDPGATGFQILTDESADFGAIAAEAQRLLGGPSPVLVGSGEVWKEDSEAVLQSAASVFLVVVTGIVAVAALATLNATVSSVVERRRQLGMLRSLGATRKQIRSLVFLEVGSSALVGGVAGLVVGLLMHRLGVYITDHSTPFPSDYFFDGRTVIQAIVATCVAVFIGGLIPALQTGRTRIAEAVAYE